MNVSKRLIQHQYGTISIKRMPEEGESPFKGYFGVHIAEDGYTQICINGTLSIQFRPHPREKLTWL